MEQALIELLSVERRERLAAIPHVAVERPEGRHALRAALWSDPSAEVRAAAAARLSRVHMEAGEEVSGWLRDGLADPSPLVREAVLVALGRLAQAPVPREVFELAAVDPVWWVRRAALLALSLVEGERAVAALRAAFGDPFWRVRHTALRAMLLLIEETPRLAESVLAERSDDSAAVRASLLYLRTRLYPQVSVHSFEPPLPQDAPLDNPDPAVITARLRTLPRDKLRARELIGYLASPHEALRRLAADRLVAVVRRDRDLEALREALGYLETPGAPHAAETVVTVLDKLDDEAQLLALAVTREVQPQPGALSWAADWALTTRSEEVLARLPAHAQHPHPQARAAVITALGYLEPQPLVILKAALADSHDSVRGAAALALAQYGDAATLEALWAHRLDDYLPPARRAIVALALRLADVKKLRVAACDPHALVRADAVAALAKLNELPAAELLCGDRDPLIRAAALPAAPGAWIPALRKDPDPLVRRRALRLAARRLPAAEHPQLAELACASFDPVLRRRGAELLRPDDDAELCTLLSLLRDPAPAVRASASDRILEATELEARLGKLLAAERSLLSDGQRAAAWGLLLRDGLDAAVLRRVIQDPREPELVRAQLRALALLVPGAEDVAPPIRERNEKPLSSPRGEASAAIERRPLGRTGLHVAPLAISGAYEPGASAIERARQAGANLFFWEPGYRDLTRFLRAQTRRPERRSAVHIVAGSFEGDAEGIRRDLERALRSLRTDYIDVFLLFWTRSPERLSDEALACLRELRAAGKVRAFGLSTHHRDLAEQASASGSWDVLMIRHSAAHPGAEERLLPLCAERGVGVLTFSALCYGRLLRPVQGEAGDADSAPLPTATECYRYSLSQPGVAAVISAPRSFRELYDNLAVLESPSLADEPQTLARLRAHGRKVRAEDRRFNTLVRRAHEGPLPPFAVRKELLALLDQRESSALPAASAASRDGVEAGQGDADPSGATTGDAETSAARSTSSTAKTGGLSRWSN